MVYIHPRRTESYKKEHPWDFQCSTCQVICETENEKRHHVETVHQTCCYCAKKDMSVCMVPQAGYLCACHEGTRGRDRTSKKVSSSAAENLGIV